MAYLDKFHIKVGETLMQCQRIEHDIKLIYAGMSKGDMEANIDAVQDKALGTVILSLQQLDNENPEPYFSKNDYRLLKSIKNVRNWLAHQTYVDFIYSQGESAEEDLNQSYNKLLDFNRDITELGEQVEKIRLDVLIRYGRIKK